MDSIIKPHTHQGAICVAFVHHKGGTGKTTACINVAGWLLKLGKRVLVVDLDPQGNATTGLGIDQKTISSSVYDVLFEKKRMEDIILETPSGVHLAPAHYNLLDAEIHLIEKKYSATILKRKLQRVCPYYDYIFIDTPPGSSLLTINGVIVARYLIVPLDSGVFACEALETLRMFIQALDEKERTRTDILQFLLLEYPLFGLFRKTPTEEIKQALKEFLSASCTEVPPITTIPYSKDVFKAQKIGMPISHFRPRSKVAEAYKKIAQGLIDLPVF